MDFRRQIVTCLFSMLRLSFETQKVKENYAIFLKNIESFSSKRRNKHRHTPKCFLNNRDSKSSAFPCFHFLNYAHKKKTLCIQFFIFIYIFVNT